jgi:hypothetical protein
MNKNNCSQCEKEIYPLTTFFSNGIIKPYCDECFTKYGHDLSFLSDYPDSCHCGLYLFDNENKCVSCHKKKEMV